nr:hypothetical protein [Acidithiobacillus thiooxidans]
MELKPIFQRVIGLDIHQAQVTVKQHALALLQTLPGVDTTGAAYCW